VKVSDTFISKAKNKKKMTHVMHIFYNLKQNIFALKIPLFPRFYAFFGT
jgi:hypothetical protein